MLLYISLQLAYMFWKRKADLGSRRGFLGSLVDPQFLGTIVKGL